MDLQPLIQRLRSGHSLRSEGWQGEIPLPVVTGKYAKVDVPATDPLRDWHVYGMRYGKEALAAQGSILALWPGDGRWRVRNRKGEFVDPERPVPVTQGPIRGKSLTHAWLDEIVDWEPRPRIEDYMDEVIREVMGDADL